MESGLRIYNVDPLVEKAHFGKKMLLSKTALKAHELQTLVTKPFIY